MWLYMLQYCECSTKVVDPDTCIHQVYNNHDWMWPCLLISHHTIHQSEDRLKLWWMSIKVGPKSWCVWGVFICVYLCWSIIDTPWRLTTISYVSNKSTITTSDNVNGSLHPIVSFNALRMEFRPYNWVSTQGLQVEVSGVYLCVLQACICSRKAVNPQTWIQQVYNSHD